MTRRKTFRKYRAGKRGGQHYWVGRKSEKRNFGSQMFRDQIKKELYGDPTRREVRLKEIKESIKKDPLLKDIKFIEDPKIGQRKIIRVIEQIIRRMVEDTRKACCIFF